MYALGIIIFLLVIFLFMAIKILNEYERGVIFRLGRVIDHKGPGLIILIPIIDRMVRVSLRTVAMDVPPQDVIMRDNVSVKVNAVIYFRVMDPTKAVIEVENYLYATSQLAQTTLRSVCGQSICSCKCDRSRGTIDENCHQQTCLRFCCGWSTGTRRMYLCNPSSRQAGEWTGWINRR